MITYSDWIRVTGAADFIIINYNEEEIDTIIRIIRRRQRVYKPEWNCWYELDRKVLERSLEAGIIHAGWCQE